MRERPDPDAEAQRLVEEIARIAEHHHWGVGVAESLTSGHLAAALGAGPQASTWFRGGIVAYASEVKFDVLGVVPGPVVTAECARQMAAGAARTLDAQAVVSVTGVGGPDPEENEPPGTVFLATYVAGQVECRRLQVEGDPPAVVHGTTVRALEALRSAMSGLPATADTSPA